MLRCCAPLRLAALMLAVLALLVLPGTAGADRA